MSDTIDQPLPGLPGLLHIEMRNVEEIVALEIEGSMIVREQHERAGRDLPVTIAVFRCTRMLLELR